jgi:hypothetical protein
MMCYGFNVINQNMTRRRGNMGWVNVNDKLPEKDERVVLYTPYNYFGKDHSCIGDKKSIMTCKATQKGKKVPIFTHWMPLPETPEGA